MCGATKDVRFVPIADMLNKLSGKYSERKSAFLRFFRVWGSVVQAQSSGDFFPSGGFFRFNGSHLRYDKYRGSLFDPLGWERQRRKAHRRSDGPQASPLIKAKS